MQGKRGRILQFVIPAWVKQGFHTACCAPAKRLAYAEANAPCKGESRPQSTSSRLARHWIPDSRFAASGMTGFPFCRSRQRVSKTGAWRPAPFKLRSKPRCVWLARARCAATRLGGVMEGTPKGQGSRGAFCFGHFPLGKQRNVTCRRATPDGFIAIRRTASVCALLR
jgi:hypothetical protein